MIPVGPWCKPKGWVLLRKVTGSVVRWKWCKVDVEVWESSREWEVEEGGGGGSTRVKDLYLFIRVKWAFEFWA